MIKANELRLGNWVEYKGQRYTASMIGALSVAIAVGGSRKHEFIQCEDINPIPITPEWLEKWGFDFDSSTGCYNYYNLPNKLQGLEFGVDSGVYLHQLQNVFFALTGEELNVKL